MQSDRASGGLNPFSKLAPTRDRQTAIDGYFEPISGKPDAEQHLQWEMVRLHSHSGSFGGRRMVDSRE